jgi:hypothetical protein
LPSLARQAPRLDTIFTGPQESLSRRKFSTSKVLQTGIVVRHEAVDGKACAGEHSCGSQRERLDA